MKKLLMLLSALFCFAACSTVQSMQQAVNCRYEIASAEVSDFSLTDINLDVKVAITNTSKTQEAKLNRFTGVLYIADNEVSNISFGAYEIAPSSTEMAKATLNIPFVKVGKNLIGLVTTNSVSVKYKIKGTMYFNTVLGEIPIPVVITQKEEM
ncbi:MAG: hypothetical protein ACI352_03300 [Elusimicrobiaceae bacterium]